MLASIRSYLWRLIHLARGSGSESSLDRELQFHLQMEVEENLRDSKNKLPTVFDHR
jgi:hypothetical protein